MSKVNIGSIVNGWRILKQSFKSLNPKKSLYKVKCLLCGLVTRKKLEEIQKEPCECKEQYSKPIRAKRKNVTFDKDRMKESIGAKRGKYIVVGYFKDPFETDSPSMKRKPNRYIVKCTLCGSLCVMSNNNLNRSKEKRDKNVRCNHSIFFDTELFNDKDYYIDEELLYKD